MKTARLMFDEAAAEVRADREAAEEVRREEILRQELMDELEHESPHDPELVKKCKELCNSFTEKNLIGRDVQPALIGRHNVTEHDSAPVQYDGIV